MRLAQRIATLSAALSVIAIGSGCESGASRSNPTLPSAAQRAPIHVSAADFRWVSSWGAAGGTAIAQCPQSFKLIGGGSSSSDGSFVGAGHPVLGRTAWAVKAGSSTAKALAQASCVSNTVAAAAFRWVSGAAVNDLAAAKCPANALLVTGYASTGSTPIKGAWVNASTNTFFVEGGTTAHAMCALSGIGVWVHRAWNQSQKPMMVFAGCGSGNTVIGGTMGDNAWPGPPSQEHTGTASNPGTPSTNGWWVFSSADNAMSWATCVSG
jgi:hypothetical protein